MLDLVGNPEDRFSHDTALLMIYEKCSTIMILIFGQTDFGKQCRVQTQIRLLLEEQSDQDLHFLLFHLHHFDEIPYALTSLFEF